MHVMQEDDCALGEEAIREALAADRTGSVLALAANAKLDCGDGEGAEALLRERLEEEPSLRLRCALGILLLRMGDRDEDAVEELELALADDPDDGVSRWSLGVARALAGDLQAGLADLRRAREASDPPPRELDEAVAAVEAALEDQQGG